MARNSIPMAPLPASSEALRQQLALALIQGQQAPQNVGQGLHSIGQSIAGALTANRAADAQAAQVAEQDKARRGLIEALTGSGVQAPTPAAPGTPTVNIPGGAAIGQAGVLPQRFGPLAQALAEMPGGGQALGQIAARQLEPPEQITPFQRAQLEQQERGLDIQERGQAQEQQLAERRLAIQAAETERKAFQENATAEDKLAGGLAASVEPQVEILDAHRRAQASRGQGPGRISDSNLARNLAKAQRPDINVDEIDPSAFEQIFGRALTAVAFGGQEFSEAEREAAFDQLDSLAAGAAAAIQTRRQRIAEVARSRGLDPRAAAPDLTGGFDPGQQTGAQGGDVASMSLEQLRNLVAQATPEQLDQLPEDVRDMIARRLRGGQ